MKLYFYRVDFRFLESKEIEHFLSCDEAEARETPKLYLPATKDDDFPCYLTRLPKDRVDTGEIDDGWLITTKPDWEAAREIWKQWYMDCADYNTRRSEEYRKNADDQRKIAQSL